MRTSKAKDKEACCSFFGGLQKELQEGVERVMDDRGKRWKFFDGRFCHGSGLCFEGVSIVKNKEAWLTLRKTTSE